MVRHCEISNPELLKKIRAREINFAGNARLKIYGRLNCKSGKRMKKENRVFFASDGEATRHHYRPCGHCMGKYYKQWKVGLI
ncbi:MAG: Ada metal-binding domain-containing protein [Cyclobacteriaceae bacterium]